MAKTYKLKAPFNVPMKLLVPTSVTVQGVLKKSFSDPESSELFFGAIKRYNGVENVQNGMYTVIDTIVIDTWYRPDIKADCRVYMCDTGETFELINDPDDINMRHQYMQFKIRKVGGKA